MRRVIPCTGSTWFTNTLASIWGLGRPRLASVPGSFGFRGRWNTRDTVRQSRPPRSRLWLIDRMSIDPCLLRLNSPAWDCCKRDANVLHVDRLLLLFVWLLATTWPDHAVQGIFGFGSLRNPIERTTRQEKIKEQNTGWNNSLCFPVYYKKTFHFFPFFLRERRKKKKFFFGLRTSMQAPVPEPTPRGLECAIERLNRYRHWWWTRPLAFPHTEWPASWHHNPCLVIHRDQVRLWTGKRIAADSNESREPRNLASQHPKTALQVEILQVYINHTTELSFFLGGGGVIVLSKKRRGVSPNMTSDHPPLKVARLFIVPSRLTKKKYRGRNVVLQRFEPATLGDPLRARHGRGKTVKVFFLCVRASI